METKVQSKNQTELFEENQELQELPVPSKLKKLQTDMEFFRLLSANPAKLAKKHPQIKAQYLPIGAVEQMLDAIFPSWSWVGTNATIMANSVVYEGVLTIQNPHDDKEYKRSGVAAIPIQLTKGSSPMQIENIVQSAIQKNLPTAKSVALKNAAQSLGNMFGRNLNRDDELPDMTKLWDKEDYSKLLEE